MARQANITNWEDVPIIFDVPYAARIFGKTPDNISRRCKRGELPAFKDGGEWRFEKNAVLEYIRQNSVIKVNAERQGATGTL